MSILRMDFRGLHRVISGGQDGVDLGALIAAKNFGIETGGTAPKGFRTTHGADPSLGTRFNLVEHHSPNYPPRTEKNVMDSDGTLIIASSMTSPGTALTFEFVRKHKKPCYSVHLGKCDLRFEYIAVANWIGDNCIEVLNVAGNHLRPDFHTKATEDFLTHVFQVLYIDKKLKFTSSSF